MDDAFEVLECHARWVCGLSFEQVRSTNFVRAERTGAAKRGMALNSCSARDHVSAGGREIERGGERDWREREREREKERKRGRGGGREGGREGEKEGGRASEGERESLPAGRR